MVKFPDPILNTNSAKGCVTTKIVNQHYLSDVQLFPLTQRPELKLCEISRMLSKKAFLFGSLKWIWPQLAQTKTCYHPRTGCCLQKWVGLVLVWCLGEQIGALQNQNTSTVTGSLTASLHRRLHSGCTHLQIRLFPDGHRFCEIFCNTRFVFIMKMLKAERNVTVVLENLIWVGKWTRG